MDVVVRKGAAILKLLTGEDETLLIGWDTFLVLDLSLHVVNSVRWLNLEGVALAPLFSLFDALVVVLLLLARLRLQLRPNGHLLRGHFHISVID